MILKIFLGGALIVSIIGIWADNNHVKSGHDKVACVCIAGLVVLQIWG